MVIKGDTRSLDYSSFVVTLHAAAHEPASTERFCFPKGPRTQITGV